MTPDDSIRDNGDEGVDENINDCIINNAGRIDPNDDDGDEPRPSRILLFLPLTPLFALWLQSQLMLLRLFINILLPVAPPLLILVTASNKQGSDNVWMNEWERLLPLFHPDLFGVQIVHRLNVVLRIVIRDE